MYVFIFLSNIINKSVWDYINLKGAYFVMYFIDYWEIRSLNQ